METTDTNTNDSNVAINPERHGKEACVQRVVREPASTEREKKNWWAVVDGGVVCTPFTALNG